MRDGWHQAVPAVVAYNEPMYSGMSREKRTRLPLPSHMPPSQVPPDRHTHTIERERRTSSVASVEPARQRPARFWCINASLIAILLSIWLAVSLLPPFFARDLTFTFIGWPFSFWMTAYGAPLTFLVIVAIYAVVMNRVDAGDPSDDERR
jgi:putative solute:sodium symporter small subunit